MKKDRAYDKKIFRLLYVLNKLDGGKTLSTKDLSLEFGVTRRTVQRDMELLNMTGFPVIEGDEGGYSFEEGFSLKRASLSKEEASLLSFLCEVSGTLGGPFRDTFNGLLSKVITDDNTSSSFYVKIPQGMELKGPLRKTADLLDGAISDSNKIKVLYQTKGKTEELSLCPLKIIFFDGFWYLLARPDGKSFLIKLRIERMENVKIQKDRYFSPPKNLKTILDQSVNIRFSEKRDIKVQLTVDADAAGYFQRRSYVPLQKITKTLTDGAIKIECKISQYEEILPIILRWLPHVRVDSPCQLKDKVDQVLRGYLRRAT